MSDPSILFDKPITSGSGVKDGNNCSVELLGLAIYGHYNHGYRLPCIDPGCQAAVVAVNDRISDERRNSRAWRLMVARLARCHNAGSDRLAHRMALWAARSVEHLSTDPRVKACNDTLERWLAGEATDKELATAAAAATAATTAAYAAAYAAAAAADAAYATAAYADTAADAACCAAAAAYASDDDSLIDWLDRYLDAWLKTAADEGLLLPDDEQEAEYVAFVEALDSFTEAAS